MVRLLMSVGSWLVWRLAEKATRPEPERTDMPRALPAGSDEGVESHTTKHFPSRMMGSVSFWPLDSIGPHNRSTPTSIWRSMVTELGRMTEPGMFSRISLDWFYCSEVSLWTTWNEDRHAIVKQTVFVKVFQTSPHCSLGWYLLKYINMHRGSKRTSRWVSEPNDIQKILLFIGQSCQSFPLCLSF